MSIRHVRRVGAAVAQALEREVGLSREQIAELDEIEASRQLDEARSKPKG